MTSSQAAAPPRIPSASPTTRLWRRYLKAKGAKIGLFLITVFGLVALLAPFLAHRFPMYWRDGASGAVTFPLVREFFSPSDTTEPFLEAGINFTLLYIPLALLAWWAMNRFSPALAKRQSRGIALLFGALFAAALWVAIGGMVVQGGGKDWLRYEVPPVPEVDDIENPAAYLAPPAGPAAEAARKAMAERLGVLGLAPDATAGMTGDAARRALVGPLQQAIDGPALAPVAASAGPGGIETRGITDANVGTGINTARWNRILVETAYPGLLTPFNRFRGSFLTLVAVTLLTLAGLTYICMAGANQFALTPRWLVLLILAGALCIPFQAGKRLDPTEYRKLAAQGAGSGLFPLIPYGPNEQGFGRHLPPTWYEQPATLQPDDILSWDRLQTILKNDDTPQAKRLADLLSRQDPAWREQVSGDAADRGKFIAALNALIASKEVYDPAAFPGLRGDRNALPYVREVESGNPLKQPHLAHFNRILVDKTLASAVKPVVAKRWKEPRHTEGYHLFGTDENGRDVLVRVIHGARVSLSVGFVSVFLATVIGLVLGSLAAYYGSWVDMAISRFMEIMMCFPSFFLILAVIAVLDRQSIINIMLVIGLTSWTGVARLIRGEMLRQKKMEYVSASIALGAADTRTIFRHILPNAIAPVLVSISFGITGAILTEASLSFIGFGVTPPTPTWGQLLSETRDSPLANWWLAIFPGIVLFLGVLAYNLVGEALRDALDPRTSL